MSLVTTSAVLLRSHPFGESSRVLRFLTEAHGLTGMLARGVRGAKSRTARGLDVFAEGDLIFYMKEGRELHTMKEFTVLNPRRGIGRHPLRLTGASVLGEIVLRHTGEADTSLLFPVVSRGLDAVEASEPRHLGGVLLREGWGLVCSFGFRPLIEACVSCGRPLLPDEMGRFDFAQGGVRCSPCGEGSAGPRVGPGARAQLASLLDGRVPPRLTHVRAHLQLLADFVTYHLAGSRPLDTFGVLADLLPAPDA